MKPSPHGSPLPNGKRKYGWVPDVPDQRDLMLATPRIKVPKSVDLRPQLPVPAYDQGMLGSCHDDQTEVLTADGWKRFEDASEFDRLASVDPESSRLIFEHPTRLVKLPYSGEMYYGKHQNIDFAVTPDHKMLVRKWDEAARTLEAGYRLTEMKSVGWYAGLMGSVNYAGQQDAEIAILKGVPHKLKVQRADVSVPMDAWLKFLGIYLAEGTMLKSYARDRLNKNGTTAVTIKGANKIQIAASKEREKTFIREVLKEMGVAALELKDRFTFCNKRIFEAMKSLGLFGVKAPNKFVPEFVFGLSGERIKSFLLGHFMGDGSEQYGLRSHHTCSRRLADDLQRLAFLAGECCTISVRKPRTGWMKDGRIVRGIHPEHRVSRWTSTKIAIDRRANVSSHHYEGFVYCAEVPTFHTLVTRRNGKILISGNCTANAAAGAIQFNQVEQNLPIVMPSRLFIYYTERLMEGTVNEDSGATIRDSIKAVCKGYPPEDVWPYDIDRFADKPSPAAYKAAKGHRCVKYQRVPQTEYSIKAALAKGNPILFGFSVYESFESATVAKTGKVPMPGKSESMLGGHAVLGMGYTEDGNMIVRNSWSQTWGLEGYFLMPLRYVLNPDLSADHWCLDTIK